MVASTEYPVQPLLSPAKPEAHPTTGPIDLENTDLANGISHVSERQPESKSANSASGDSKKANVDLLNGSSGTNGTASASTNVTEPIQDAVKEAVLQNKKEDSENTELGNGVKDEVKPDGLVESEKSERVGIDSSDLVDNAASSPESKKRVAAPEAVEGTKKRKQSVLNFSKADGLTSLSISTAKSDETKVNDASASDADSLMDEDPNVKDEKDDEYLVTLKLKKTPETPKGRRSRSRASTQPQEKVRNFDRAAKKPLPKEEPLHLPLVKVKKGSSRSKQPASSTTILRENNRNARPLPGPLVPLHYDLYDGNVIASENNKAASQEKLAFGFPIQHNPNLYDIMYILLFLTKFEPVVQAGALGPDDFEKGLDLASTSLHPVISQTMEVFFRRLLVLLLNRKKPIPKDGQRPAIQELQTKYASFGLPEEWRDDSLVHHVDSFPCNPEEDVVDPTKPPVSPEDLIEYERPKELPNPFHSKSFEDYGLAGIESPRQRVVLLRTMVVWCLSVSMKVKTFLTSIVNKQEVPGERDNIYVARSVMKGFAHTSEARKDHEVKMARKTKPSTKGGMQDFDLRLSYMDPTSNPMTHPLALRLNEYVVGDLGFHMGRFYLVRTADASAGGLGSLSEMKSAAKMQPGDRSMATNFRLYVEDVYSLLNSCLRVDGVEFDAEGNEVPSDEKYDDTRYWYTVASNYEELKQFHELLELKLGTKGLSIHHGSDAYRPLAYFCQYLRHVVPIIGELEGMYVGGGDQRTARKKTVDYSATPTWEEGEAEFIETRGDGDYSEDGEEEFDEEDEGDEGEEGEEEEAEFLD